MYNSTADIHSRIFSVAAIAMVLGFLRPRRAWLTWGAMSVAGGLMFAVLPYLPPGSQEKTAVFFTAFITIVLSAAGGMATGVIGRHVFTSSSKRPTRN
jgi:hypothetical protein